MLSYLFTPSPSINYKVITSIYFACALLFSLFFFLESYLKSLESDHWAYDNLDQIKGIYIIGIPFAPFTVWSANLWRIQSKQEPEPVKAKSE